MGRFNNLKSKVVFVCFFFLFICQDIPLKFERKWKPCRIFVQFETILSWFSGS